MEVEMLRERKDLYLKVPISDILGIFRRCPVVGQKIASFCKIFKKGEVSFEITN